MHWNKKTQKIRNPHFAISTNASSIYNIKCFSSKYDNHHVQKNELLQGTSDFSWADEFISSSENQETNQTTASVLQQGIDEVITASSSLPVIASQNNSITTSQPSFILTNTTGPVPLANQNAGIQFVQQQQQTQSNQSQQIITSLPNLIGLVTSLWSILFKVKDKDKWIFVCI